MSDQPKDLSQLSAEEKRAELERLLALKAQRDGTASVEQQKASGLNLAAAAWKPPAGAQGGGANSSATSGGAALHPNLANCVFDDGFRKPEDPYDEFDDFDEFDEFDPYMDEDEEWDEEAYADLEAFEEDLQQQNIVPSNEHERRKYTESEPFKFAKLGNLVDLMNFYFQEMIELKTFEDNRKRTLLHFAADSGHKAMVEYLLKSGVPVTKDDKGMTPYDVAKILGYDQIAQTIQAADAYGVVDASVKIEQFLPAPPGMSVSKPPAAVPRPTHTFWGQANPQPSSTGGDSDERIYTVLPPTSEFPTAQCLDLQKNVATTQHLDSWLIPFAKTELAALGAMTVHVLGGDKDQVVQGMNSVILLREMILKGATSGPYSMVGNMWCNNTLENMKGKMAQGLMSKTYELLKGEGHKGSFFHSKEKLPFTQMGTLKYFMRCVEPKIIFKSAVCDEVFSDFNKYETEMRVDSVLKGKLWGIDHSSKWAQINWGDKTEAQVAAPVFVEMLNGVGNLELDLYPNWDVNNFQVCFQRPGLSAFVLKDSQGTTTDVMLFRTRRARNDKRVVVCTLVASAFTSIKGEHRLFHAAQVAKAHLSAHVVYTTNTYGITEKDCRLSFFQEVKGSAEFMYCAGGANSAAIATIPPAKIGIPFGLF